MRVCPRCRSVYCTDVWTCYLDGEALLEQAGDPLVGGAIERYRILELLGQGAMGRVYRARHAVLDRAYAVKVLFGDYASELAFRERFRREAQAISKIRHPNIVSVEDFGSTREGLTFLVLELVLGETLDAHIAREAPRAPERVIAIARQVAAGLGAAHAHGFVHRDVKPSNVMLTSQGSPSSEVKVLDFGAVGLLALPRSERLTRMGRLIGTPTYMAPEQSQDPGVEPTADLYALGVMMFEMLTGKPPFTGTTRAEVLVQHVNEPPPKLPPLKGLERVVARLLEKDPERRPQSVPALFDLLDEVSGEDARGHATTELEPVYEGADFPVLGDEPLEVAAGWRDWAREAALEPYELEAIPPAPLEWSSAGKTEDPSGGLDDQIRQALARDLTIDEAALLYEPAMPKERRQAQERDDGATQVDFNLGETNEPDARTEVELPPEDALTPLHPLPPAAPVRALLEEPPPPHRKDFGSVFSGDLPLEAPIEAAGVEPPTLLDEPDLAPQRRRLSSAKQERRSNGREGRRAAEGADEARGEVDVPVASTTTVEEDAPIRFGPPPRLPSAALAPAPPSSRLSPSLSEELVAEEIGDPSRPLPSAGPVAAPLKESAHAGASGAPSPRARFPGLRSRPAEIIERGPAHASRPLVSIDEESTASVRRRRMTSPPSGARPPRGRRRSLDRWLLPMTVALLMAAALALAAALVLRPGRPVPVSPPKAERPSSP